MYRIQVECKWSCTRTWSPCIAFPQVDGVLSFLENDKSISDDRAATGTPLKLSMCSLHTTLVMKGCIVLPELPKVHFAYYMCAEQMQCSSSKYGN